MDNYFVSRCDFYDNIFTNVAVTGTGEEIGGSSSWDKWKKVTVACLCHWSLIP